MALMNASTLTAAQRRNLRSHAHHLHPLVMIGHDGLTAAVLAAISQELKHHELIKVRVFGDDRGEREALLEAVCKALACEAVQHIGKLFVLYRAAPGAAKLDPNLPYAQSSTVRQVIPSKGAQLTKKQAASGKTAAKNLSKKEVQKLTSAPRKSSRSTRRADADLPVPRAGKYNAIPGNSAGRRTHLSAADRRAAYATVTERAPRPTTKPQRVTKPRKSAATTAASRTPRKSSGRR
jgi:RNA-binding protein